MSPPDRSTFGSELKARRLEKGMTLRELGTRAAVDYTYLSKLEAEKVGPPRREIVDRLSKALEIPLGELLLVTDTHHSLSVVEILQALLKDPEAIKPEQWKEIDKIARDGLDEAYHIRALVRAVHELPLGEPKRLRARRKNISRIWSTARDKVGRSLWSLLHLVLRGNVRYELVGSENFSNLARHGRKIIFVANHRDVTALTMYLLDFKPNTDFDSLIALVSSSQDGREAIRFLERCRVRITAIQRPSVESQDGPSRRDRAFHELAARFNAAGKGTAVGMVIDERKGRRDRHLSQGAVVLAHRTGATLLPVVTRNRLEFTLENSWDKHRIPLSSGQILIGQPFDIRMGQGRDWRKLETTRLHQALEDLDAAAARSVNPLAIKVRL